MCTASEVQCSKGWTGYTFLHNLRRWTGSKLNYTWGDSGLNKNLIGKVVSISGSWGWLPDHDIANKSRSWYGVIRNES